MIQKRFQHYTADGIEWTKWFDFSDNDELLLDLQKREAKQLGKLKNEYRIKPEV